MGTGGRIPVRRPGTTRLSDASPNAPQDPRTASTGGRMFAELGAGVTEVAGELEKAQTFAETLKAKNALAVKKADIMQRVSQDTNTSEETRKKYHEELSSATRAAGEGISLQYAKDNFGIEANAESEIGKLEIDNIFRKRVIDNARADSSTLVDRHQMEYINSGNPSVQGMVLGRVKRHFNSMADAGFMSREEAAKEIQKATTEFPVKKVDNDLMHSTSSAQVEQVKTALTNGAYEHSGVKIDPQKKAELIRRAETYSRQLKAKENFTDRMESKIVAHNLIDLKNNGLLTASALEESFKTKQISNTLYQSLQEGLESTVGPTAETDKQTYFDLTNMLLDEKVNPEEAAAKIIKANADGKLSTADARKIYGMHLVPSGGNFLSLKDIQAGGFDKSKATFEAQIEEIADKRNWFKSAFRAFNSFFSGPQKSEKVVEATKQLVDNIASKKIENKDIPGEADSIIAAENLKKHPDWAKLPKEGKRGRDKWGNKVIVYPDGRVVESK